MDIVDEYVRRAVVGVTMALMISMMLFTNYTVVMRYVFHNPPLWGDTIALFCNIWLVLIAYYLAIREDSDIKSEAIYSILPDGATKILRNTWRIMTMGFGIFLLWFGWKAALSVPGAYWELGGVRKGHVLLIMPVAGTLVIWACGIRGVKDLKGSRRIYDKKDGT